MGLVAHDRNELADYSLQKGRPAVCDELDVNAQRLVEKFWDPWASGDGFQMVNYNSKFFLVYHTNVVNIIAGGNYMYSNSYV